MKLEALLATDDNELVALENVESLKQLASGRAGGSGNLESVDSIRSLGIVGAGLMGTAVAAAATAGGLDVLMTDVDQQAVANAEAAVIAELVASGRKGDEAEKIVDQRLCPTSQSADLAACDLVIESVAEKLHIKQQVYAELEPLLSERTILATNTSTIPISQLASGLEHPERFCGAHFFHPVRERPLLEIIRGTETDPATVEILRGFATAIGKMPIVVEDGPGFLVNRLLLPYVTEAMELLVDGVDIHTIERVAEEFGMAKGPLRLLDEIGLDTTLQGGWVLSAAFPERTVSSPLLVAMIKAGNLGTKTGSGFFEHAEEKVSGTFCAKHPKGRSGKRYLTPFLPIAAGVLELIIKWKREESAVTLDDSVVLGRLLLPMILEATRLLEDGTVSRAADIDLGVLFGLGFPANRGGLLFWADQLGAEQIIEMLGEIKELGPRAQPTGMLLEMAVDGRKFYSSTA